MNWTPIAATSKDPRGDAEADAVQYALQPLA
jgi:hypothetical protein